MEVPSTRSVALNGMVTVLRPPDEEKRDVNSSYFIKDVRGVVGHKVTRLDLTER